MVPLVIFVCLLIANSSSEYATKSKFSEETIVENLKNSIEISSSNRTDGNSKDIFQKILPTDTLMLTKDVGDKTMSRPYSSVPFKIDDEMSRRRIRLCFTPTSFWLTGRILFYPNLAAEEMSNYNLLLGHTHFDYVEPLLNHTSSTAKLG